MPITRDLSHRRKSIGYVPSAMSILLSFKKRQSHGKIYIKQRKNKERFPINYTINTVLVKKSIYTHTKYAEVLYYKQKEICTKNIFLKLIRARSQVNCQQQTGLFLYCNNLFSYVLKTRLESLNNQLFSFKIAGKENYFQK